MMERRSAGRPTAQASAGLYDRLIEAAWQILLDCGPDHFTLDRLAAQAHASKQTIYARFSGKAELLAAVLASRLDIFSAEMVLDCKDCSAEEAFVDLAYRVAVSLSQPEAALFDRLLDWLDAHAPDSHAASNRFATNARVHELMSASLVVASQRWGLGIADIPAAATFWVDGVYGHVRGVACSETQHRAWAENFGRFYVRAVKQPN